MRHSIAQGSISLYTLLMERLAQDHVEPCTHMIQIWNRRPPAGMKWRDAVERINNIPAGDSARVGVIVGTLDAC